MNEWYLIGLAIAILGAIVGVVLAILAEVLGVYER